MLVLSRKKDERIVIPGVGEIVVQKVVGGRVWLGFEFDSKYQIRRGELPTFQTPETFVHREQLAAG